MKKNSTIIRYFKETDKILLLLCLIASVFSILCLMGIANTFSSITRPMKMQILASILGIFVALIISSIDYHTLAGLWKIHMPLSIILVIATLIFGMQRAGADDKAWLILPGGLSFQPSEILKLSFILTFALHLSLVHENVGEQVIQSCPALSAWSISGRPDSYSRRRWNGNGICFYLYLHVVCSRIILEIYCCRFRCPGNLYTDRLVQNIELRPETENFGFV